MNTCVRLLQAALALLLVIALTACTTTPLLTAETTYPPEVSALPGPPEGSSPTLPAGLKILVGPQPYPTPLAQTIPLEQMINQSFIKDVQWVPYQGELRGGSNGQTWQFSINHPSGWQVAPQSFPNYFSIENQESGEGMIQEAYIKLEIALLVNPPLIEEGEVVNLHDLTSVSLAGKPAVVLITSELADMAGRINLVFQNQAEWFALVGTIALPEQDAHALQAYTHVLLAMMASFIINQ